MLKYKVSAHIALSVRKVAAAIVLMSLTAGFFMMPRSLAPFMPTVEAASPDIVIGQVYGGGGNSGATFSNDFVEIFNRGSSAVSLSGKSIQYASATGTS